MNESGPVSNHGWVKNALAITATVFVTTVLVVTSTTVCNGHDAVFVTANSMVEMAGVVEVPRSAMPVCLVSGAWRQTHSKGNSCIVSYSGLLVVIHSKECTADKGDGTGRHLWESATCVQLPGWRERGWPVRHSSHSRRTL